jgi:hypothetical protein
MNLLPDFVQIRPLPPTPEGWHRHDYAALADGALAVASVDRDFAAIPQKTLFRDWPNARLRLCRFDGERLDEAIVIDGMTWPFVNRFADGRWVVVSGWATPGESNVRLFAPDGSLLNSFETSEASLIACATDGLIWFGYSDQQIFGASPGPDDSWPASTSGLAAFDENGLCQRRFALDNYSIAQCYALTTTGEEAWACTYTDFPILRLVGGEVRCWNNRVVGARAIAAGDGHVILAGGYNENKNRVTLLRLDEKEAEPIAELRLPGAAGVEPFLGGTDGVLHVVDREQWSRIAIKDWLSALG